MKSKKLTSGTVMVFDSGDEVVSTLTKFAKIFRFAEEGLPEKPGK